MPTKKMLEKFRDFLVDYVGAHPGEIVPDIYEQARKIFPSKSESNVRYGLETLVQQHRLQRVGGEYYPTGAEVPPCVPARNVIRGRRLRGKAGSS